VRQAFASQLGEIEKRLEDELDLAPLTLARIAEAFEAPTDEQAASIVQSALQLRLVSRSVDADLVVVTARQAPVASDLRLVLGLIQLAHHGALIANQFELISEQLSEIDPNVLDHKRTAQKLSSMTMLAASQLQSAVAAFASRDLASARDIDRQDDAIDRLNREIFEVTLELDADPGQRELALRHVLIARSVERIGDNAVDIAEQAAFLVTAELHEFSDASHPKPARPNTSDPTRKTT
jgi:phosphate transport system protein